jgi:hypothetical protein
MASIEETAHWLTQFEDLCTRRCITQEAQHLLWEAMAHVCDQQMHDKQADGPLSQWVKAESPRPPQRMAVASGLQVVPVQKGAQR